MSGGLLTALPLAALGFTETIADWAADAGYIAVLLIVAGDGVVPLFPGETSVIAAAVFAADGRLSITLVIVAGAVGAVIGDSTAYWIGRIGGVRIKRAIGKLAGHDRVAAAERMIERQGAALVFVGRFLPGFRLAVNVSCGAGQMRYGRFVTFDSLGAALWSTQAALLGFFLGKAFAGQLWLALLVALGVAGVVAMIVWWRERAHLRRERERAASESVPLQDT